MVEYFEKVPKDRRWRARAKVGTHKRWYRPVETTASVGEFGFFSGKHLLERSSSDKD